MAEIQDETPDNSDNVNINTAISDLPPRKQHLFRVFVELPMFITLLATALTGAAVSNIVLYRTCVHALNHSKEECHIFLTFEKNNGTHELEKEVQQYATFVNTVKSVIESVAPAILSMFLGVWSDTYGRKPLIEWPIFGMMMSGMLIVLYAMFDDFGPWWYILTIVPYSLTGGFTVLFTGCFCYLSDVTTTEQRSLRMTLMEAAVSIGSVIGGIASSYVLKAVGHVYLLLIAATLYVIEYVYINVCMVESLAGAVQGGITSVLDIKLVKEMLRECFKSRPNNGRAQILLLTVANSLSIFTLYGLMNLEYLYSRAKLNWNMLDYTMYSSINSTISFVGSLVGIAVLQKLLRISDLAFSIIAFISAGVQYFIKAFAVTTWHMYFAGGISLFKDLSAPLIRSLLTKILPVMDIAKVFALMSAIEGICPLFSPALYNTLYEYTISDFPGAVYIISGATAGLCAVLIGFVQYFRWRVSSPYEPLDDAVVAATSQNMLAE